MMALSKYLMMLPLALFCISVGQVTAAENMAVAGERLGKVCAGCHGTDGASPGKLIPIIGGQKAGYTSKVLGEFAAEKRPGSVMWKLAKGFSADEAKQIAAYFEAKPWVNTPHAPAAAEPPSQAKSCQACHGKMGEGRGVFPRIGGQHPDYLFQALMEYKKGERSAATMALVKKYDEATLQQLADYYSSIR